MTADPLFAAEMDYCGPLGLPRSHFLGGPPRWTQADRDAAVVWRMRKNQTCSCGTREDEWDPAQGGRDDAYVAELRKCWGCDAAAAMEKNVTKDMGAGVSVVLVRNTGAPRVDDDAEVS